MYKGVRLMLYNDLLTKTIFLTKRNNLSNSELGEVIGLDRASMSGRSQRNSKFKPDEETKIEKHYGIKLNTVSIINNSMGRQNDIGVTDKFSQIGKRYAEIQEKHNFLDREMAQLLEISEKDYIGIKVGKKEPSIKVLNNTKRNFKVSMDWLMYGEG